MTKEVAAVGVHLEHLPPRLIKGVLILMDYLANIEPEAVRLLLDIEPDEVTGAIIFALSNEKLQAPMLFIALASLMGIADFGGALPPVDKGAAKA